MLAYIICRVLLLEDILPFSIGSVHLCMNHWNTHWHILAVGLLPIYVGLVFFGAALSGLLLGPVLQRWFTKFLQQHRMNNK